MGINKKEKVNNFVAGVLPPWYIYNRSLCCVCVVLTKNRKCGKTQKRLRVIYLPSV